MKKTDTSLTKRFFAMVLTLLMVLCMLPVQTITAYADDGAYTINFTVLDQDKDGNPPIQGAQIKLDGQTQPTDADGKATFTVNQSAGSTIQAEVSAAHFHAGNPLIRLSYQTVDFKINLSEDNPVKVKGIEKPYSLEGYAALELVDAGDCALTYSLDGETYGDMPTIKEVGDYTVYVKATAQDGFEFAPFTVDSKIVPATIGDITVTANEGLVYNKDGVEVISAGGITGLQSGDFVEYIVGESTVKEYTFSDEVEPLTLYTAGDAAITVNVTRGTNYFFTTTLTVNIAAGESGLHFKNITEGTEQVVSLFNETEYIKEQAYVAESDSDGKITYSLTSVLDLDPKDSSAIATIDENGTLTINKAGIVDITAEQEGNELYGKSSVTVRVILKYSSATSVLSFSDNSDVDYVLKNADEIITRAAEKAFKKDSGKVSYGLSWTDDENSTAIDFLKVSDEGKVTITDQNKLIELLEQGPISVKVTATKEAVALTGTEYYPAGSDSYVINLSMSDETLEGIVLNIPEIPESGWFNEDVNITRSDNGQLKLSGAEAFGTEVVLGEGTYSGKVYFLNDKGEILRGPDLPDIKIDKTDPVIGEFTYSVSPVSTVLKYITLGATNDEVTISVPVEDELSGIASVTFALPGYGEEGETFAATLNEETASFTFKNNLKKNFIGAVTVTVNDVAGNAASKTGENQILMDNTVPVITAKFLTGTDAETGKKVYDAIPSGEDYFFGWNDTEVFFEIDEENFGLQLDKNKENPYFSATITEVGTENVWTETFKWKNEGAGKYTTEKAWEFEKGQGVYQLNVDFTDIAGNKDEYTCNFKFDGIAPEITKTNCTYTKGEDTTTSKELKRYSNADEINVAFTVVEDNFVETDFVNAIKITLDGDDYAPVISVTEDEAENTWIVSFTLTDQGDYSISISGYADPSGKKMDKYSGEITIDRVEPKMTKTEYIYTKGEVTTTSKEPTRYSDADKIDVAFIVEEKYFENDDFINAITIMRDNNEIINKEDFISVNKGEAENTWIVSFTLADQGDYNITIDYADPAGNEMETYESGTFTIDRTPPKIDISCATPAQERDKIEYYGAPIQATVTITERYFDGKATITVTKTDENGKKTEFTPEGKWTDGENYTHDYTFTLDEDGQYAISVEYTDPSGNFKSENTDKTMILDQTPPVVTINYNAPVQKANNVAYYDGTIQGTITVREVNFFEEDFHISVNDAAIGLNWVDRGDFVHVAVFTMAADGEYDVTASYSDRSYNRMPQHESGRMIVDTKAPVITVDGVRHQSANNDETISLTVSVADKNISIEEFEAVLKAVVKRDMGNNSYKYESETVSLGDKKTSTNEEGETVYTYTLENLSLDGYYTLKASATDYAGHAVKLMDAQLADGSSDQLSELNFSVNREGSVFWIETEHNDKYSGQTFINELDGAYANDQVKLAVHEVNVDPVDTEQDYRTVFTLNDGTAMQEIVLDDGAGGNYEKNQSVAEGGWYENIYTLDNSYFENDGTYSLNLITYDAASNSNINSKDEGGVISFTVDRTLPIISSNIHAGQYVRASEYVVEFRVTEANLDPESISVTLDGKSVEPEALGNNEYRFTVGSGYGHVVEISAGDKANNVSEQYKVNPFTVSTNIFVLWYANKLLFWGSLLGLAVICGTIGIIVTRRKRDEKDKA